MLTTAGPDSLEMKEENSCPLFLRKRFSKILSCFIFVRLSIQVVIWSLTRIHSRSDDVVYILLFFFMSFLRGQTLQDGNETVIYTISDPYTLLC